jgi:hypothetical protein
MSICRERTEYLKKMEGKRTPKTKSLKPIRARKYWATKKTIHFLKPEKASAY